jgi:hypothetical protein
MSGQAAGVLDGLSRRDGTTRPRRHRVLPASQRALPSPDAPVQAFARSDVKAMMGRADISTTMIYVHHGQIRTPAAHLSALLGRTDALPVAETCAR